MELTNMGGNSNPTIITIITNSSSNINKCINNTIINNNSSNNNGPTTNVTTVTSTTSTITGPVMDTTCITNTNNPHNSPWEWPWVGHPLVVHHTTPPLPRVTPKTGIKKSETTMC